jgi:acyl-CoA synthetase (AMP-forming)/AMP-acid ligase II
MRCIDYFDKGAEIEPDRAAIVQDDLRYTFADVQALTFKIASAMKANGLKHQDHVAIYSPNHANVILMLLSIWRAAAIWIPVNARNAIDANIQYMNYVRTGWLFYHSHYAKEVAQLKAGVPSLKHFVCLDCEHEGNPSLANFMKEGEGRPWIDDGTPFGNLDEIVGIFPTGGTTGPAKGVNVTNLGWGTMLEIVGNALRVEDVKPVCLVPAPLTHAAGPVSLATLAIGATNVVLPGFEAGKVLENIERYKVTHLYCPPTALYMLLDHPKLHDHDYSSLRRLLLVGSPVSPEKFKQAVEVFGPCLCQSYGQVEVPMILTWLPPDVVARAARGDHPERLASCGKPSYPMRVGIMDDAGKLLPVGEPGEIVARGALVSHSYFEKAEATTEVRAFGWHHTGDVGYRDKDGYIYIVDRKKDMIVTGGFNVFSAEVEACVMEMQGVKECAVVGVPHEKWGEAIKAIVVPARGVTLTEEAVIAHCKARLGSVKAPKSVEFWTEIPKTPNNKMDKKAIRKRFWSDADRNVH